MRHQVKKSKLNRSAGHRTAMVKTLTAQLIQYEHIDTTNARAKEVLPLIDKVINIGKKNDMLARRRLNQELFDELAIKKVLEVLASRYPEKTSGYASVVKLGKRHGDRAEIVRVMLLES